MKKLLYCFTFLFLIGSSTAKIARGQTNRFEIGMGQGLSLCSLHPDSESEFKTLVSYAEGISLQYNFKKLISIRTGMYYERKGAATTDTLFFIFASGIKSFESLIHIKDNYDYFTFLLLIRITLGKKLHYFVEAGGYIATLLKQTVNLKYDEVFSDEMYVFTEADNKTDAGITFGLGLSYPVAHNFDLSFEVRDNFGLMNINKETDYFYVGGNYTLVDSSPSQTRAINFLLCFSYKFSFRNL